MASMSYILGLDLAQKADFSALAAIKRTERNGYSHYVIHGLERLPHGLPYPKQIEHVYHRVVGSAHLQGAALAVDETGVGSAVVDLMRIHPIAGLISIWPILITGGTAVTEDEIRFCSHVPKRDLVNTLSALLENSQLEMVPKLPYEESLKKEFANFTRKITQALNETFGVWREGQHDDLVLAVALACWLGEQKGAGGDTKPNVGPKGMVADLPADVWMPDDRPKNDPRYHGGRPPLEQTGMQFPSW
jgi:hypothetical protein